MTLIYYVEVNMICVILLFIFRSQLMEKHIDQSVTQKIFNWMLSLDIVFCVSDMLAGVLRGQKFEGAKVLIEISNLIYYEALAGISFVWLLYVLIRLEFVKSIQKKLFFLMGLPFVLFTIIAILNPITHFLFSINENNLYVRGNGVYLHWVVTWGYLITSTILTIHVWMKTPNQQRRQDIKPVLYFIVAPMVASLIQMFYYGVTSTQVGVTLSLVLIFVNEQHNQVLMDSLTGMNNRRGLQHFFEDHILNRREAYVSLMMLDLNNFKHINDTLGHLVGDKALIVAAQTIRMACMDAKGDYLLCRYGGDEFVIAGIDINEAENKRIIQKIDEILEETNRSVGSYTLKFSIGQANGMCSNAEELGQLLKQADELMYENKQRLKQ